MTVPQKLVGETKDLILLGLAAERRAAVQHDLSAGKLLLEASTHFESAVEFDGWVKRNLNITPKRARSLMYMASREVWRAAQK